MQRRIKESMLFMFGITICAALIISSGSILHGNYKKSNKDALIKINNNNTIMSKVKYDYERYFINLGHTIRIISSMEKIQDILTTGAATNPFPLQAINIITQIDSARLHNLCPVMRKRVYVPELKRTIFILGTGDEIRSVQSIKILQKPIAGSVKIGHEIHTTCGIKNDNNISILGKSFIVSQCMPVTGSRDDITIYMNLQDAQDLFNEQGMINEILAVSSIEYESLQTVIRDQTSSQYKILAQKNKIQAMIKSQKLMERTATEAIVSEQKNLIVLKTKTTNHFILIFLSVIMVTVFWIVYIIHGENSSSKKELAIFSTIGMSKSKILTFLIIHRSILALTGTILGVLIGYIISASIEGYVVFHKTTLTLSVLVVVLFPLITSLVSLLTGLKIIRKDPASLFNSI
jgi:ABC-type lipoprotein release transport system permease subunit